MERIDHLFPVQADALIQSEIPNHTVALCFYFRLVNCQSISSDVQKRSCHPHDRVSGPHTSTVMKQVCEFSVLIALALLWAETVCEESSSWEAEKSLLSAAALKSAHMLSTARITPPGKKTEACHSPEDIKACAPIKNIHSERCAAGKETFSAGGRC